VASAPPAPADPLLAGVGPERGRAQRPRLRPAFVQGGIAGEVAEGTKSAGYASVTDPIDKRTTCEGAPRRGWAYRRNKWHRRGSITGDNAFGYPFLGAQVKGNLLTTG